MELENVSEEVKREAKRVAVAFDIQGWESVEVELEESGRVRFCGRVRPGVLFECQVDEESGRFDYLVLAIGYKAICEVFLSSDDWHCTVLDDRYSETMARGLYRLGFEDADVYRMLDHRLTAHEQLELRLSMSCEFWPQKWMEEENAARWPEQPDMGGIRASKEATSQ